jgi:hypothetical protein
MATPTQTLGRNDADKTAARTAAAFGVAAAITALFNVALAFVKDAYAPLNTLMAHLTGHHWVTHGLADLLVFFALGWLFTARGIPARGLTGGLVVALGAAVVVAGAALGGWFVLF